MDSIWQIFDVTLLATVALIFAVTLFGAYLRSRQRDECLRSFEGFQVTVERAGGKLIWGQLHLESSGMELHYRDTVQDSNHIVSSYVIYAPEYGDIQAIYRYVDQLDEEGVKHRARDLRRSFHPGPFLRLVRGVQHFFYLANESLSDVMGIIIGRLRKPAGRYITDTSEEHLRRLGTTVIGSVGGNYDPLMENLVGHKVVADVLEGDEVHEHVGIFKNYSADFIELLNVQFPERESLSLASKREIDASILTAVVEDGAIRVTNRTTQPILIQSLSVGEDDEELLNIVVNSNESVTLHPEDPFEEGTLNVRVVRELDMIVPRTRCVVRHRAERYKPDILPEIIFDLGIMLTGSSLSDAREARLRKRISENPYAAIAMSNLGAILVQKRQYREAKYWLEKAYDLRNSLPDNGNRTMMQLHELERKADVMPDTFTANGAGNNSSVPVGHSLATNGHESENDTARGQDPYSGM